MRLIVKANDDQDILDFLADLENRNPIILLDRLLKENRTEKYFILMDRHHKEGITTVLLINTAFDINENGNILMLFAHPYSETIQGYFKRLMEITPYEEKNKRIIIRKVLNVIDYYILHKEELEESQISKMEK